MAKQQPTPWHLEVAQFPATLTPPHPPPSSTPSRYGILYGMGVRELAAALDRPVHSAVAVQEQFRQRFAGLARFTETVRRTCREVGYVETLFGRRRYLPLIRSEKVVERNEAERMAVNSTFQVCGWPDGVLGH